mmetsp:Transcript_12157/g.22155  ORF Transcript_12157/g.22155 Transcript_12157/m.22155 type:complete len:105 (+) Transcript_12157:49-363(+)|eukprot:CAMPEP_0197538044 /NCGR_PEP_ID=MMETSP1318-20131121/58689_1 /TAXON_ID=552666 /ORGANISM="Partenskyella glossopodia, Strain RCC365" /LENGTH=104 /DNA_ID=CAMNT_0043096361 /DNA_START=50 /DNA_END=364 /DNA_ORIENTATION=-
MEDIKIENEESGSGITELYYPRKCSATNRLIAAKDHASVQINIGHVDQNGTYTNEYTTFALSGYIRFKARGDEALNRLAAEAGLMKAMDSFPHPAEASADAEDD